MKRSLGTASVFAICTGAMFSSGFFLLPGLAADESGPSLPLAYLSASLLILPAIFSMAELSSAIPRAGGPYLFLKRSMGTLTGVIGAFGKYVQLLLKGAFAFVGVGTYLSLVADVSVQPVAIALIAGFTFLNLLGVQQTATTEKLLVAILLVVLSYFLAAGITEVLGEESDDLREPFQPLLPYGIGGFFSAIALVFVSYAGIGQIASISEEIKDPAHAIPKGMLLALGTSTLLYLFGTAVMISLLSSDALRGDNTPVATAAAEFTALPLPVMVVVIAALAAFASTGNAAILSAARYPLALARDRLIWSRFGNVDDKGVPKTSVIVTGILLVLLVVAFDVKGIAKMASAFLLFVFMGMCLAVAIFRESNLKEYKPGYRSPLYPWMQIAGVVAYIALIILNGLEAVGFIVAVCVAGSLWYFYGIREEEHQSAAIFRLFGRLARSNQDSQEAKPLDIPLLSDAHFADVVRRAIVFDLEEEEGYEEVIQHAADALKDHLGGDREEHADRMREDVRQWMSAVRAHVAVAPALLHGIEQPEMVLVRGKIHIEDKEYNGLIVLVDDEASPDRLMELLSRLNAVIRHTDFPEAWQKAEDEEELKSAFLGKGVQALTISIDGSGPAASLEGSTVRNVDLPEGSILALIQREGRLLVPHSDTQLQKGDEITLVAESNVIPQLNQRFKSEES